MHHQAPRDVPTRGAHDSHSWVRDDAPYACHGELVNTAVSHPIVCTTGRWCCDSRYTHRARSSTRPHPVTLHTWLCSGSTRATTRKPRDLQPAPPSEWWPDARVTEGVSAVACACLRCCVGANQSQPQSSLVSPRRAWDGLAGTWTASVTRHVPRRSPPCAFPTLFTSQLKEGAADVAMYLRRVRHASQLSRLPLTVERHCVGSAIAALELACVARRPPAARLLFNGRFVWRCRVQSPHLHRARCGPATATSQCRTCYATGGRSCRRVLWSLRSIASQLYCARSGSLLGHRA